MSSTSGGYVRLTLLEATALVAALELLDDLDDGGALTDEFDRYERAALTRARAELVATFLPERLTL